MLRLLTGLLFLMLGTMLVRYVAWGTVWLLTGSHLWILPNLMSETVSLRQTVGRVAQKQLTAHTHYAQQAHIGAASDADAATATVVA